MILPKNTIFKLNRKKNRKKPRYTHTRRPVAATSTTGHPADGAPPLCQPPIIAREGLLSTLKQSTTEARTNVSQTYDPTPPIENKDSGPKQSTRPPISPKSLLIIFKKTCGCL